MSVFFLILFFVVAVIHLWASLKKDKKLRARSKVFLLLSLLGWYWVSADSFLLIFAAALFFSWLGDVLLIPDGIPWFTAGGIAFMVSHICFVFSYNRNVSFGALFPAVIVAAAVVYAAAVFFVFRGLKPYLPKALFYPMFLYLLINGTMNCFALYQLLSLPCIGTAVVFIGAVLFFCSDSLLFYTRFKKDTKLKTHFPVMVTYIVGEFLIVLGTLLIP